MLLQFTVENFLSFRERVTLSALPSDHIPHDPSHLIEAPNGLKALRVLALYGANASGKTNVLKALQFAQRFITEGVRPHDPIPVTPFKLDPERAQQPSTFSFDFIAKKQHWSYGFSATSERVTAEWLYKIHTDNTEDIIFDRATNEVGPISQSESDQQTAKDLLRLLRPNQLFLSEASDRPALKPLKKVFDWFTRALNFVENTQTGDSFSLATAPILDFASDLLRSASTGISKIKPNIKSDVMQYSLGVKNLIANRDPRIIAAFVILKYQELAEDSQNKLPASLWSVIGDYNKQMELLKPLIEQGMALDVQFLRGEVPFNASEESEGTKHLLHLSPMLYRLRQPEGGLFVIDELERSLHPHLTRFVLQSVLQGGGNGQLIFTTHDTNLLDRKLLPADSVWFTEKNGQGATTLYSLSDFKVEQLDAMGKTVERGYLEGRFGAIPFLGSPEGLGWVEGGEEP